MDTLDITATMPSSTRRTNSLDGIARSFLNEWNTVHGHTGSISRATLHANRLTVLMERVLTEGELRLKQQPAGKQLVQRHLERLLDQIYPKLAPQVEERLGARIAHTSLSSDPDTGCLLCVIHFHERPRQ